jgi:hypothetical protein
MAVVLVCYSRAYLRYDPQLPVESSVIICEFEYLPGPVIEVDDQGEYPTLALDAAREVRVRLKC